MHPAELAPREFPEPASNLPTPVAAAAGGSGSSIYTRSDEILNYEISNSETHEIVTPGSIKKISLSVLVDNVTDEAQLETLRSAVGAAVGIDEARGDLLVVENTIFDKTYLTTQTDDLDNASQTELYWKIGQIAGAVILLIRPAFLYSTITQESASGFSRCLGTSYETVI